MKTLLDMIKKLVDTDSTTTEYVDYLDDWYDFDAVSYTHLTLPTIYSV